MQVGYEQNRDFRQMSRFTSEMIQDMAIVAMECDYTETVLTLANDTFFNVLE